MPHYPDRPLILISNDDGITAPGISNLIEAVKDLGRIVVVAPDSPQSGMGHAISITKPLRMAKVHAYKEWGVEAWQTTGTPADCVKLAKDVILERKPDICISGINHGSNASINVIYSGTMSAAMEAAIDGIPSAGFSLMDFSYDADFSVSKQVARKIVINMLNSQLNPHFLLNVNIPKVNKDSFNGIKVCRQADAFWAENFEHRIDPGGRNYYWMTGKFVNRDKGDNTDIEALKKGFASVVPIQIDFTDKENLRWIADNWNL